MINNFINQGKMSHAQVCKKRVAALRGLMKREQLDAYIIPSFDPHQSEYVHDHWKAITWISNFSGSAGTLIITLEEALLWTDSRYYTQAKLELKDTDIKLYKEVVEETATFSEWLVSILEEDQRIGFNGALFSIKQVQRFKRIFERAGLFIDPNQQILEESWIDRPIIEGNDVFEVSTEYVGESRRKKLSNIRNEMRAQMVEVHFLSSLDDIAWVLNLRGSDIECNPVFFSYLWISLEEVFLFVDKGKISETLEKTLKEDGVKLIAYNEVNNFLAHLKHKPAIWIDGNSLNFQIFQQLQALELELYQSRTIPYHKKGVKNKVEIKQLKKAMVKDGVALVKLFIWLESILDRVMVSEFEVSRQLGRFRQAQGNYYGESFHAIVGYKENGAIIHYRPKSTSSKPIKPEGILLLDSGGQYLEGTTDITRTVLLGNSVTQAMKDHYTLVLKGNIALSNVVFPEGTTGLQLDVLARQFLWQKGLNYGHGTGHGVGYFLNVHEGPQGISTHNKSERSTTPILEGMITSNEPGLYLEKAYGIRIENLILCKEKYSAKKNGRKFLCFEALSLYPFDLKLIEPTLLNQAEKQWVNDYHQKVFERLSPMLSPEEQKWLEQKCQPIR